MTAAGSPTAGESHAAFLRLPETTLDALAPAVTLILAPHPDDESLGTGGLIAALCAAGRPPHVAILTDGSRSHPGSAAFPPPRLAALRETEAADATAALGLPRTHLHFLRLPDTQAPTAGPGLEAAAARLAAIAPAAATVFTTYGPDPHCDHEAAAAIGAATAARLGARLWFYPIWFWTLPPDAPAPPAPGGCRLPIAPFLPRKAAAIAAHRSQHAGLITDTPEGFALPRTLLAPFERPWETFLTPSPRP